MGHQGATKQGVIGRVQARAGQGDCYCRRWQAADLQPPAAGRKLAAACNPIACSPLFPPLQLTSSFQNAFFTPVAAPTTSFALVAEGGRTLQGVNAARLWRWNGTAASFSKVWDIKGTGTLGDVRLDAYSDKRAVAAGVFDLRRIVARRWYNNRWEAITTLTCARGVVCAVSDLVALPSGSALLTLVGNGGLYRLFD